MSLKLVNSDTFAVKERLSDELSEVVKRYFAEHASMSLDDAERALQIWEEMKELDLRLECDCQLNYPQAPMLLAAMPRTIRRMPEPANEAHDKKCRFILRNRERDPITFPPRTTTDEGDLAIHVPFPDPEHTSRIGGRGGGGGQQLPRIASVLFTLLEKSFVNWMFHDQQHNANVCAAKVANQARDMMMCSDDRNTVHLGKMLVTATSNFAQGVKQITSLREAITQYDPDEWPYGSRPHGYMISIFDNYKRNTEKEWYELSIPGWRENQYIDVRPHVFAEGRNVRRSPYIGIVSYALPNRTSNKTHGMRCYLQPCFSQDSWFPVDSGYERYTMETMLNWRKELPNGWSIDIKKPLFDEMVENAEGEEKPCRPDFILRVKYNGNYRRHVAVETMGILSDEYEERKCRTHPLMLTRWGLLVQHNMTDRTEGGRERMTDLFIQQLNDAVLNGRQTDYETL